MNIKNIGVKKLCEYILVSLASLQFITYLTLMILQHQTSKIIIINSINILASFFGSLFIIFTLVKNLKDLHRKSYMVLGVLAFLFRGVCLFSLSYYYKSPTQDFFITNETDNALLYSNFIWMGCYIAMFHVRPKSSTISTPRDPRLITDYN